MSDIGTYHTEKYGDIDIAYVPTGKNCGYWVAKKSETGKFLGSADSYNELIKDIEGHGGFIPRARFFDQNDNFVSLALSTHYPRSLVKGDDNLWV